MQYVRGKKLLIKACLLLFIGFTACINSAKAGLDYYRIFLGKKMIYERYVNKPLDLQNLSISAADVNETLTIYYFQCNAPGKTGSNRSIILKDDKGNTVKHWTFANKQGDDAGMMIPVKELLQLQKGNKNTSLALYYAAEGRTEGMKLAFVRATPKEVSFIHQQVDFFSQITLQAIHLQVICLLLRNAKNV